MKVKVNKERVRLLVEALRSGEYEQTQRRLFTGPVDPGPVDPLDERITGWCCLGVACTVAAKNGLDLLSVHDRGILPDEVRRWFSLDFDNPTLIDEHGEVQAAATLNDNGDSDGVPYNFHQIADAFERTYLQ